MTEHPGQHLRLDSPWQGVVQLEAAPSVDDLSVCVSIAIKSIGCGHSTSIAWITPDQARAFADTLSATADAVARRGRLSVVPDPPQAPAPQGAA